MSGGERVPDRPWTWRTGMARKGAMLTTCHGGAKVVLASIACDGLSNCLAARDERGILEPIEPHHPVAEFIVRACNSHDELVAALDDACEALMDVVDYDLDNGDLRTVRDAIDLASAALSRARGEG